MKYFPVKLDFFLNDQFSQCDVYLKIGANYVHYIEASSFSREQLLTLQQRSCEQVFLDEEGMKKYVVFKKNLLAEELKKHEPTGKCLDQFINNHKLLTEFYMGVCGDKEKAEYIQNLGQQGLKIISRHDSLSTLFEKARGANPETLVEKQLISFFATSSLKYFDHIEPEQLEKLNVAILLTDVCLPKAFHGQDLSPLTNKLPPEYLNHPQLAIDNLPNDPYFQSTTISNVILNHHERPDGRGFPNKLPYSRFDLFLATYYLSERLVSKLVNLDLNLIELSAAFDEVLKENKKYSVPNFERALRNIESLIRQGAKK